MSQIKNIIFDLGGVLLNINPEKTFEAFAETGIIDPKKVILSAINSGLFDEFEKGLMTADNFRPALNVFADKKILNGNFDYAWNAMLLDFPKERIEFLFKLKEKYNLYLLSNTNIIHYKHYNEQFAKQFNCSGLDSAFTTGFYSFNMGLRKPELEIYNTMISLSGINPSESLFIEDTEENLHNAKKAGLKTCLIERNSSFYENKDFLELIF